MGALGVKKSYLHASQFLINNIELLVLGDLCPDSIVKILRIRIKWDKKTIWPFSDLLVVMDRDLQANTRGSGRI